MPGPYWLVVTGQAPFTLKWKTAPMKTQNKANSGTRIYMSLLKQFMHPPTMQTNNIGSQPTYEPGLYWWSHDRPQSLLSGRIPRGKHKTKPKVAHAYVIAKKQFIHPPITTGQAPVTLEWKNTLRRHKAQTMSGTRIYICHS